MNEIRGEGAKGANGFNFVQIDKNVHIQFNKMFNNQTSFLFQPSLVDGMMSLFLFFFFF